MLQSGTPRLERQNGLGRLNLSAIILTTLLAGCSPAGKLALDTHNGDLDAVRADLQTTPIDASIAGLTPLCMAAAEGQLNVVQYLIKAGAKVDGTNEGMAPLTCAADGKYIGEPGHDYPSVISALVEAGANVNALDKGGGTALGFAVDRGNASLVPIFVAAGADPNAVRSGSRTPLEIAAFKGDVQSITALVNAGANINYTGPDGSDGPLATAVEANHLAAVQLLISDGANVNGSGPQDQPLVAAAKGGYVAIVRTLLDAAANPNGLQPPETPLKAAQDEHHDDVAALLIRYGART